MSNNLQNESLSPKLIKSIKITNPENKSSLDNIYIILQKQQNELLKEDNHLKVNYINNQLEASNSKNIQRPSGDENHRQTETTPRNFTSLKFNLSSIKEDTELRQNKFTRNLDIDFEQSNIKNDNNENKAQNEIPNSFFKFMNYNESIPSMIKNKSSIEESYFNKNSQETEKIINKIANEIHLSARNPSEIYNSLNSLEENLKNINFNNFDKSDNNNTDEIILALSNLPASEDNTKQAERSPNQKDTTTTTNELNNAYIKTNLDLKTSADIKSKDDVISNLDSGFIQKENNNEDGLINEEKVAEENIIPIIVNKTQNEKNSSNANNTLNNKNNLESLFKSVKKKDEAEYIEEAKNDIQKDIDNLYQNNELNLVKINNKEQFIFITEYNDRDVENNNNNYYTLEKLDTIDFINRRDIFLLYHNYFSLFAKSNELPKLLKNETLIEKIKKFQKNYNQDVESLLNDNEYKREYISEKNMIMRVSDIEDMSSFFYNFCLYKPDGKNNEIILDEKIENEIIKSFTTYREILNDGNSFKRAFSYLLLENFVLKNKTKEFNYIINDIKKSMKNYKNINQIVNILIDIKENYGIDYLMNTYNNPNINFDETMISYIENSLPKKEKKYKDIDNEYLYSLAIIFNVNIEIFYIEFKENNNKNYFTMNKYFVSINNNENSKTISSSEELNNTTTFRLLFFLNSFHIIYTKKCDMDSTLANKNLTKIHYFINMLPKYKCPTCNKVSSLDILPLKEAVLCHDCLIKHMEEILYKRVVSFIEDNFSSIEFFTRPLLINENIEISFSLYKYITNNYITNNFEYILKNICFNCYKFVKSNNENNNERIIKLKCRCQLCQECLEEKLKENNNGYNYLNLHEFNTIKCSNCFCGLNYKLRELFSYSKIIPTNKDMKDARQRLIKVLENNCCVCFKNKDKTEYIKLNVANSPFHFICNTCHRKNILENQKISKTNNEINHYINDFESSDSALRDNEADKKIFCKICNIEHIIIPEVETNNSNDKKKHFYQSLGRCCCKKKCTIF